MLWHKIVIPATWETEAGGGRILGPRGLYGWTPPQHKGTLFAESWDFLPAICKLLVY